MLNKSLIDIDTRSLEYVKRMSEAWRLNHERNIRIEAEKRSLQDLDCIAEIEAGLYE